MNGWGSDYAGSIFYGHIDFGEYIAEHFSDSSADKVNAKLLFSIVKYTVRKEKTEMIT